VLRLDAASYRPDVLFDVAPSLWEEGGAYVPSPDGRLAYQNRLLPAGRPLRLYGKQEGKVYWNGDVVIPTLIDTGRWWDTGEPFPPEVSLPQRVQFGAPWMSLTPMEMLTHRRGAQLASHTVVLGGLGLGWLLRKVCEKPEVERVVVVEKSRVLLDWYGYRLCGRSEKVRDVLCDDVFRQVGRHGPFARYLLDVWHVYSGARDDARLAPLRRTLKRRLWAWGLD
jgi:hypothetical protein